MKKYCDPWFVKRTAFGRMEAVQENYCEEDMTDGAVLAYNSFNV